MGQLLLNKEKQEIASKQSGLSNHSASFYNTNSIAISSLSSLCCMRMYYSKIKFLITFIILSGSISVFAGNNEKQENVIYIKGIKFINPLIEKWVGEYAKVNPHVKIKVADKEQKTEDIDIRFTITDDNMNENRIVFPVSRYALLPVTTKESTLLNELGNKKLNRKKLTELFFEKDLLGEDFEEAPKEDKYHATIYSGNSANSVSAVFASHFGYATGSLKGKKISGDDIYIIQAIQKDNTGVSFNTLNYIYDLNTRQLKDRISLLPLDVKKEYYTILAESNLDKIISLLEEKEFDLIPVEEVNFAYKNNNPSNEAKKFLAWILSEGQVFNHSYGLLNLSEKQLAQQKAQMEEYLQMAEINHK